MASRRGMRPQQSLTAGVLDPAHVRDCRQVEGMMGAAEQELTRCAGSHLLTPPATDCHTLTACCAMCLQRPLSDTQGPHPACTVHNVATSSHAAQQLCTMWPRPAMLFSNCAVSQRHAVSASCLHRRGSVNSMQQPSEPGRIVGPPAQHRMTIVQTCAQRAAGRRAAISDM